VELYRSLSCGKPPRYGVGNLCPSGRFARRSARFENAHLEWNHHHRPWSYPSQLHQISPDVLCFFPASGFGGGRLYGSGEHVGGGPLV